MPRSPGGPSRGCAIGGLENCHADWFRFGQGGIEFAALVVGSGERGRGCEVGVEQGGDQPDRQPVFGVAIGDLVFDNPNRGAFGDDVQSAGAVAAYPLTLDGGGQHAEVLPVRELFDNRKVHRGLHPPQ